jgi:hypothetical protein
MNIKALTKLHISLTVFLATTIIAVDKANSFMHRNGALLCIMLGIAGFTLWLMGGFAGILSDRLNKNETERADEIETARPPGFARRSESWGLIFMLAAGAVSPFIATYSPQPVVVARARPSASITNAAPAIVFPPLNLQGITFQGQKSSALINGRVLFAGEGIGNVRIVTIEASRVIVEMDGQTKTLSLRE